VTDPLFVRWEPRPNAQLRLVCFPHAGVGASVYRVWQKLLPAAVELIAIQLPGRETRLRETPLRRIADAVDAVVPALRTLENKPYAFFGHSMGAVIAWDVARALHAASRPAPARLILSGRRAPGVIDRDPPLRHLSDEQFVSELNRRYGGIPAQVAADRDIMALLLPGLRADIAALETHQPESAVPLNVPLTILGGTDDERAPLAELEAWRAHSTGPFRIRTYPGGHFYLNDHRQSVVGEVLSDLATVIPRPDGVQSGVQP